MTLLDDAIQFREIMGQPVGCLTRELLEMQITLILEECDELSNATVAWPLNDRAREEALKELADVVYVCYQLAAAAGWDLDVALERVHHSNLSKLVNGKPLRREDGKVLKGPHYRPPSLIDLV